jgi:hypothetical protein
MNVAFCLAVVISGFASALNCSLTTHGKWASTIPTITTNHVFRLDQLLSVSYACAETLPVNFPVVCLFYCNPMPDLYAFTISLEGEKSRPILQGNTYALNEATPFQSYELQRGFAVPTWALSSGHTTEKMRFRLEMRDLSKFWRPMAGIKVSAVSPWFEVSKDPLSGQGVMKQDEYIPDSFFTERGEVNDDTIVASWFTPYEAQCQKIFSTKGWLGYNDYSWNC